jgi:hypothetical protein
MSRKFFNGIDLTNQKAVNVASPSSPTDGANKSYVDNLVNGQSWKPAVRAGTTTAGTLASSFANGSVIDGVTLATGDRILVKNQAAGAENGIYVVAASGAPTRAADGAAGEVGPNATVFVEEGTTLADTSWTLTNNGTITVGTTALTFAQTGGGQTYTAGSGLALSAGAFSVAAAAGILAGGGIDTSVVVRKFAATIGDGTTTAIAVTHSLGTRDVMISVHDAATFEEVECDKVKTSTTVVTLTFATAPAASAYRVVVFA